MDITLTMVKIKSTQAKNIMTIMKKERVGIFSTGKIKSKIFKVGQHINSNFFKNLLSFSILDLFSMLDTVTLSSISLCLSL